MIALLTLLFAAGARASEQSQALGARGLIELNAGHDQAALELFDRAVEADPNDPDARYLRGTVRAKRGDTGGAIDDLRAALAARPEFPPAALELGVALIEAGRPGEAENWLVRAQQQPDLAARAAFYLGIAELRLDRLDEAQASFERARAGDPSLELPVQYYRGVIAFRRHELSAATERFQTVQRTSPESAMGREAGVFLERIRRSARAAYGAFGTVALEYDSNVTLGPSTPQFGATGEGDGRVVLNAGGRYVPFRFGPASLSIGYEFFQSLQFQLTDFNLQDNRPGVQLQFDFDRVSFGVIGRYDYYLLSTDSFLQEATAFPWVTLREPGIGHTDVYARIQRRDYKQQTFFVLDGFYSFAGLRQAIDLGAPGRQLWFGYQLGFTTPTHQGQSELDQESELYQYAANQLEVGLRWPLPYAVLAEVGYRFELQNYNAASSVFPPTNPNDPALGGARQDHDHRVIVSFERPLPELNEHLFAVASWFGTWNNSNKPLFEYTRQIGSIGMEVRF